MKREYSVADIDRMRLAIDVRLGGTFISNISGHNQRVENELRTCMQNGTAPEEVEAALAEDMKLNPDWY